MPSSPRSVERFLQEAPPAVDRARLRLHAELAPYTTFRVGGPADAMYDATSADDLANVVQTAWATATPCFVLGLGANILVGDKGFRGLVVRNCARAISPLGDTRLRAESGVVVKDLILDAVARSLSGLEHYIGIPSTVGGAVWQNLHFLAPAPARERTMFIAEVVESCDILSEEGERRSVGPDYLEFGYDTSVFHRRRDIALAVTFRLSPGDAGAMHRVLQENLSWRGSRHPWLEIHPSAGSIFKKIEGVGAGRLIDECGLKGYRVGDAQISYIHANIIVNLGAASASDIRGVIRHAQESVAMRLGHELEPEIAFVGEF